MPALEVIEMQLIGGTQRFVSAFQTNRHLLTRLAIHSAIMRTDFPDTGARSDQRADLDPLPVWRFAESPRDQPRRADGLCGAVRHHRR